MGREKAGLLTTTKAISNQIEATEVKMVLKLRRYCQMCQKAMQK